MLPFCGDNRKMQLIVSRVPDDMCSKHPHEWALHNLLLLPVHKSSPSWKYLVGSRRQCHDGRFRALGIGAEVGREVRRTVPAARAQVPERHAHQMYDFKAPRSNICGELFRKLEDYLLKPMLPLRLIECREGYKANVMQTTIWNRLARMWELQESSKPASRTGASIQIKLATGETVPAEVR